MITWKFYADAGLTVPLSLGLFRPPNNSTPVDRILYFGSLASGQQLQAQSNPGIDPITVGVVEDGAGLPATAVRLATSAAGLSTATPGAPVELAATLNSGIANAVALFVRVDNAGVTDPEVFDNLALETNLVQ